MNTPAVVLALALSATLTRSLTAQQPETPVAPVTPIGQPADKAAVDRPLTPQERIAKLEAEYTRLKKERDAIRAIEQAGGLPVRMQKFLDERAKTAALIAANTGVVGPTLPTVKSSGARLLGDAEKASLAPEVVFTVQGLPVTRAEFDAAFEYLKSYPHDETDEALKSRIVMEFARVKAAEAAFATTGTAALAKIQDAAKRLKAGQDFAAVAKELSDCASKEKGGDVGMFGRDAFDLFFAKAAFGTKIGVTTDVVATDAGYVILRVTGSEKGATGDLDKVRVDRILAAWTPDVQALRDLQTKVKDGGVDLGFVSEEFRKFAPAAFKR